MKAADIGKLMKYLFNVSGEQFAKDVYGKEQSDSYTQEKFGKMQRNTMYWVGELDNIRLTNLAEAVNKYEG